MIKVLGRNNSSNVQKVLFCLEEIGVDYSREDYGGEFGKTTDNAYLAMNPNATVPTLIENDFVMWESNACVRYLSKRHSMGTLCPMDMHEQAICDQWMDWQQTAVATAQTPVFWGLIRTRPEDRNHDLINNSRDKLEAALEIMEARLGDNEWMAGDRFTMADIPLGIMIYRWYTLNIKRKDFPNIKRWYDAMGKRPAFEKTVLSIELT